MLPSSRVQSVMVSAFVYSTEDEEKVRTAVLSIIPPELKELTKFTVAVVNGYYGDQIKVLKAEHRRRTGNILTHILRSLSADERKEFLNSIEDRVDESGNIYVRLDKQKALLGTLELGDSDPVRLKFHIQRTSQDLSPQAMRRILVTMLEEKIDSRAPESEEEPRDEEVR